MTLGHWVGVIPEDTLPEYQDADILEVLKRLASKHKAFKAEELENGN
jgi:hypothetical protein